MIPQRKHESKCWTCTKTNKKNCPHFDPDLPMEERVKAWQKAQITETSDNKPFLLIKVLACEHYEMAPQRPNQYAHNTGDDIIGERKPTDAMFCPICGAWMTYQADKKILPRSCGRPECKAVATKLKQKEYRERFNKKKKED